MLKARREKRRARKEDKKKAKSSAKGNGRRGDGAGGPSPERRRKRLEERSEELTGCVQEAEERIAAIDATFAEPGYYDRTPPDAVAELEAERSALRDEVARLLAEWEEAERELAALS